MSYYYGKKKEDFAPDFPAMMDTVTAQANSYSATPHEVDVIAAGAAALPNAAGVVLDLPINIGYNEKGQNGAKFGTALITSPDFNPASPVHVCILLHGLGECGDGSLAALKKMTGWGGWYVNAGNPSMFGAVNRWPIVFVMVQTTSDSAFSQGEIEEAISTAHAHLNVIGDLVYCGISLGGFGMLNWGNTAVRLKNFYRGVFLMPGGNGSAGVNFPTAAIAAGLECLFFHAADDKIALPIQSTKINAAIKAGGGKSDLVMYESGGHAISTRPMNAYFPWSSVNATTFKTVAGSYLPTASIFDFLCAEQEHKVIMPLGFVVTDKQEQLNAFQKADGSIYFTVG